MPLLGRSHIATCWRFCGAVEVYLALFGECIAGGPFRMVRRSERSTYAPKGGHLPTQDILRKILRLPHDDERRRAKGELTDIHTRHGSRGTVPINSKTRPQGNSKKSNPRCAESGEYPSSKSYILDDGNLRCASARCTFGYIYEVLYSR